MLKIVDMFSYEDIYELLRAEKLSTDLQPLRTEDLKKISEYLKMKENLLLSQDESVSLLSTQKRVKIQLELDNTRRTLRDLYEKRERKVLTRSIVTVRSGVGLKDTTNMLKHEQELYEHIITILSSSKDTFFEYILSLGREGKDPMNELHKLKEIAKTEVEQITKPEEAKIEVEIKKEKLNIKFIDNIQEFYGEDLKNYGPYKEGDIDELPGRIANLLISQNKARLIENEVPETDKYVLPEVQNKEPAQGNDGQAQAETKDQEARTEMGSSTDV